MKPLFVSFSYNKNQYIGDTVIEWEREVSDLTDIRAIESYLSELGRYHPYGMDNCKLITFRRME